MQGAERRGFWISFAVFLVFFLYLVAFGSNLWRLEGNIQIAGLVLAAALLGGWLVWRGIYAKARFPRTGLEWVFAFGLAVLCLSWLASPDPGQGGFRAGWLAGYLVFFIVMLDSLDAGLNRWGALAAFLTISGLLLFQVLVETFNWYSQWWPFIQKVGLLNVTPYRFNSMLIAPGPVMAMGAMGFPMAVLALIKIKKPIVRVLAFYWLLFYIIALPFSSSRGGWMGLAVTIGVAALLIIWEKKLWRVVWAWPGRKKLIWGVGLGVALLVVLLGVIFFMRAFASHASHGGDPFGTSGREGIWGNALSIWRANPILGAGPGRFPISYLQTEGGSSPGWWAQHAHSTFVQSLAEFGALGFLAWLALAGIGLWRAWKWYRSSRADLKPWNGAALAALVALVVELVFDEYSGWPLVVAFPIFLAAWLGSGSAQPVQRFKRLAMHWIGLPGLALIILSAWGIHAYQPMVETTRVATGSDGWSKAALLIHQSVERSPHSSFYASAEGLAWAAAWGQSQDAQELERARAGLRAGLALEPGYAQLWANLAVLDWHAGDAASAMEHIDKAIKMAPKDYSFVLNRGWFKEQNGDLAGASADYIQALTLDPTRANHPFWAASPARSLALKQATPAQKATSLDSPYARQAFSAAQMGDLQGAEAALAKSWADGEPAVPFSIAQAAFYEAAGEAQKAEEIYVEMMASIMPSQLKLITGEFSLGMYTVPGFLKLEPDQGQFEAVEKLVGIYRARGECDKAQQAWEVLERAKGGGVIGQVGLGVGCP